MPYTVEQAIADGWGEKAAAYTAWRRKVDYWIGRITGWATADDIADYNYADEFTAGASPRLAARAALAADDFPLDHALDDESEWL